MRHHRSRFLKGPVPWDWIIRASELPGRALIVGLCLWRLSGAVGNRTVTFGNAELQPFGIDRAAKSRALAVLESAGLVTVERKRGRLPIVTLPSQAVSTVGLLRPLGLARR
jgi:DNA-binding transcriptional ArsR family regulator